MLRVLDAKEVAFVSGGMMEDAEYFDGSDGGYGGWGGDGGYDPGASDNVGADYGQTVSQDVPSPIDTNGDIVVTATQDQVNDAKEAYEMAGQSVTMAEYGTTALNAIAGYVGGRYGLGLGAAAGSANQYVNNNADGIRNSLADAYYYDLRAGINPMQPLN